MSRAWLGCVVWTLPFRRARIHDTRVSSYPCVEPGSCFCCAAFRRPPLRTRFVSGPMVRPDPKARLLSKSTRRPTRTTLSEGHRGVHQPSFTVYLPPADKATGTAMIIAPGGGHAFLNFDEEGTYVAEYPEQHRSGRLRAQIPPGARAEFDLQDRRACPRRRAARHPSGPLPRQRRWNLIPRQSESWDSPPAVRSPRWPRPASMPASATPPTQSTVKATSRFRRADLPRHPRQPLHHPERYAGDILALRRQRSRTFHRVVGALPHAQLGVTDGSPRIRDRWPRFRHQSQHAESVARGHDVAATPRRLAKADRRAEVKRRKNGARG